MIDRQPEEVAPGLSGDADKPEAVLEAGTSLASRLRTRAAQLAVETKRFDLPGWDGEIQIEVKRPSRQESRKAASVPGVAAATKAVIAVATVAIIVIDGTEERRFESWAEFGEQMMDCPAGTDSSDVISTVLPAEQLVQGLTAQLGEWAQGQAIREDDELGE